MLFHAPNYSVTEFPADLSLPAHRDAQVVHIQFDPETPLPAIMTRAITAEPAARHALMRLPSPITTIATENDFVSRCERLLWGLEAGQLRASDVPNLPLLTAEIRECLAHVALFELREALRQIPASFFIDEGTEAVLREASSCLEYCTQRLDGDMYALRNATVYGHLLDEQTLRGLSLGLRHATLGVGAYYGWPVVRSLQTEEFSEYDDAERLQRWHRELGRDARDRPIAGRTADSFPNDVHAMNPVDLLDRWLKIEKKLFAAAPPTPQEGRFLLTAQQQQRDFCLLYAGALLNGALDDFDAAADRIQIDVTCCGMELAVSALSDAHLFAVEIGRILRECGC